MYRVIRITAFYDLAILVSPPDFEPEDPNARYYLFVVEEPGIFKEVTSKQALGYFSGHCDGAGFGELPGHNFRDFVDFNNWRSWKAEQAYAEFRKFVPEITPEEGLRILYKADPEIFRQRFKKYAENQKNQSLNDKDDSSFSEILAVVGDIALSAGDLVLSAILEGLSNIDV